MSTAIPKANPAVVDRPSTSDIDRQIRRGKAVLRELKATLEDLEDRRELAAAKKRNAGKPGTSLRQAAKRTGPVNPHSRRAWRGGLRNCGNLTASGHEMRFEVQHQRHDA